MIAMLPEIWASPYPGYVRLNTRPAVIQHKPFKAGKAEIISEGEDVTLLVYGMLFEQAYQAKEILENQGLKVGLINLRSLKPVDEDAVLKVAANSNLLVTIEDHFLTGGLYSILAEIFLKSRTTAHVLPFALNERWFRPGLLSEVLNYEGFTGTQIAAKITEKLQQENTVAKPILEAAHN
jgi:transketolase